MTTARVLIRDAYRAAGLIGKGEEMDAEDGDFGLRTLNGMLDGWTVSRLYARQVVTYSGQVGPGASFTIGDGQDVDTGAPCPPSLVGGFFRSGSVDYTFQIIGIDDYNSFSVKTTAAPCPDYIYYSPGPDVGTCFCYPAISGRAQAHISVTAPLEQVASLNTDIVLPPGYRDAIVYSLGEDLCVGDAAPPPRLVQRAYMARERIRRSNVKVPNLQMPSLARFNVIIGR